MYIPYTSSVFLLISSLQPRSGFNVESFTERTTNPFSQWFLVSIAPHPSIIRRLLRRRQSTYSRNAAQFVNSLTGDLFIALILYSFLQEDGTDFCFRKKHAI